MNKKEIVKTISDEIGLTQLKTKEIVQRTLAAIIETLADEGRIELRNFGIFEVKKRAPRKARNPRTGAKVSVPAKFVVTFKPGKEMEERIQHPEPLPHASSSGGGQNGRDTLHGKRQSGQEAQDALGPGTGPRLRINRDSLSD
jgi:nucleoid DNA-binding protein